MNAVVTSKSQKWQMWLLLGVFVVGAASMLIDVVDAGDPTASVPVITLQAGMPVVPTKPGAYACAFADTAHNSVTYVQTGRQDKFQALFESRECRELPRDQHLQVIAVDQGYVQIRGADQYFGKGAWAPPGMLQLAQ
ncbi:hypothetical protein [Silvimonas amylolytica]|uniref:Protease inhibitor Inh n=1 Tax=Silvimonas amylolytica TaxID=449663 RepID=A0ABQ2PQ91_9NEIS|nr:hypothetical protein [Silvimonas amylolytica]GGP27414.1 hypothetical protein GCM10010971_32330 [Silvimonas amylolytica]